MNIFSILTAPPRRLILNFTLISPVLLTEPLLDDDLLAQELAGVQPGLGSLLHEAELVQVHHGVSGVSVSH